MNGYSNRKEEGVANGKRSLGILTKPVSRASCRYLLASVDRAKVGRAVPAIYSLIMVLLEPV